MKLMISASALRTLQQITRMRVHPRAFEPIAPPLAAAALVAMAIAVSTILAPRLGASLAEADVRPLPPQLPKEWRWEPPVVDLDHMYMPSEAPRRLDWIREPSRARSVR